MSSLRFRYQTLEFGETDIHIKTLRDKQQYNDDDGRAADVGISPASWPLFGTVWASGEVLAQLMMNFSIKDKRILEVGCGIGLASLMLNQREADITATDHHPMAGDFLRENTRLNQGRVIPFYRTDWQDSPLELGDFDLIIGSDLLYERDHVEQLSAFVEQHARTRCEVIIVDPGRAQRSGFSRKMLDYGYNLLPSKVCNINDLSQPFRGQILHYQR